MQVVQISIKFKVKEEDMSRMIDVEKASEDNLKSVMIFDSPKNLLVRKIARKKQFFCSLSFVEDGQ